MQLLAVVITAVALASSTTANVAEMIIGSDPKFKGLCGNSDFEDTTSANSPSIASCLDLAENVDMPVTYKISGRKSYTSIPTAGDCKFEILPWDGSSVKNWFIGGPDVADSMYFRSFSPSIRKPLEARDKRLTPKSMRFPCFHSQGGKTDFRFVVIHSAIKKYGKNGKFGARGDMKCAYEGHSYILRWRISK